MELRVFDKTAQPLGAIDELASLLWHTKYFDVGTFSLLAPITDNNSRLLVEGNLITKHDGKKEVKTADGGVWRRAAQITYVHITKDENGLEQLEAQGYMLSWWLNKRCIYQQIVATGTNQYLINLMVKNNCGSAAGTKRRFPLFTFLAQETIDGVAVEYANEVYAQLGQEVKVLWSSFFVTLVAKKIVLINLCCRPCFIWGSITIITVWTNMIIINVCKFFYLLIECFLCCKLIQICAFILQGIEITLHRCIVVRISCFAHALCHIYRFAEFGKCFGRIL